MDELVELDELDELDEQKTNFPLSKPLWTIH
jgi:hypothetical protein